MTSSSTGGPAPVRLALALALAATVPSSDAQESEWLRLQAPRFGVVSQLDEARSRRWAIEFDQFIATLQRLVAVDDAALPPLTIVLFDGQRQFDPYRPRNESGEQPDVVGVFGNYGTWSVIGMAAASSSSEMRSTVYHEAVHWFLSANPTERPMWFEEGYAETLSTFALRDGKGRLGIADQGNLDYLQYYGVRPLDEFLRATRDDAHKRNDYYPQAWALVHYLLFGNNGELRAKMTEFLRLQRETDLDTAFTTAFGMPYGDMTNDLRAYVQRGRYIVATVDVPDRGAEMTVAAASPASVEFALARLAVIGNNNELARRHVDAVIERAPNAAPAYELRAVLASRAEDKAAMMRDLDKAIELGSTDSIAYSAKGFSLLEQHMRAGARFDEMLAPDVARTIADLFNRSIELRPGSRDAYRGLMSALANVSAATERDEAALAVGRLAFPTDGIVLVGQAVLERLNGDLSAASRLVRRSRNEPFTMSSEQRRTVNDLQLAWFTELVAEAQKRPGAERVAQIEALLDEQLADPSLPDSSRNRFNRLQLDFRGLVRLNEALAALEGGRRDEGKAILSEIANDQSGSEFARRQAERLLERFAP